MREAARIQSFPDSFRFASGIRATERQIGNAVPPVLAWHVARAVEAVIKGERKYWEKSVSPEKRITHWLKLADKVATGWKPSKCLFQK